MIIQTEIRPATTHDLLHAPGLLKIGVIYFLRHPEKCTMSGPYVLCKYHNSKKLEKYYKNKCIYVPVIDFDFDIANDLQQQDLKAKVEALQTKNQKQ